MIDILHFVIPFANISDLLIWSKKKHEKNEATHLH